MSLPIGAGAQSILGNQAIEYGYDCCNRAKKITTLCAREVYARIYKEKTKQWHDQGIQQRELIPGNQVLLYNSRLKFFLEKIKSRWSGPFKLVKVHPHETVELLHERTCQEF